MTAEYPDPQPFLTSEEFAREHHDDIEPLSDKELDDQRFLAPLRRAVAPKSSLWLRQRLARLDAEWDATQGTA